MSRSGVVGLLAAALAVASCAPAARQPEHPAPATFVTSAPGATVRPATPAPVPSVTDRSAGITIEIGDDLFTPPQLVLRVGTTITWINHGQNPHTATAHDESFASPVLLYGGTFTQTFTARGRHLYTCLFHPNMWGDLVVE